MASTKNLMTAEELNARLTPEQRSENARKAGIQSGKVRNLKSMLLEELENGGYEKMVEVALEEMKKGNPKFWEMIRDTVGEKPVDKMNIEGEIGNVTIINDIPRLEG